MNFQNYSITSIEYDTLIYFNSFLPNKKIIVINVINNEIINIDKIHKLNINLVGNGEIELQYNHPISEENFNINKINLANNGIRNVTLSNDRKIIKCFKALNNIIF
jgi:hypothetical protein